jgi:hypothetical protein
MDGPILDLFVFQFVRLLERAGTQAVLACADAARGRRFVKVGRAEFCSETCRARIAKRRERERDRAPRRLGARR